MMTKKIAAVTAIVNAAESIYANYKPTDETLVEPAYADAFTHPPMPSMNFSEKFKTKISTQEATVFLPAEVTNQVVLSDSCSYSQDCSRAKYQIWQDITLAKGSCLHCHMHSALMQ